MAEYQSVERKRRGRLLPIAFVVMAALPKPAAAGGPEVEADRCRRWLDGFVHGRFEQVAAIAAEQLRPGDVPEPYLKAQRENLARLYDKISKIGSGPPSLAAQAEDVTVEETGDIIKRQLWQFGKVSAYVGCVSYPGTDSPWHIAIEFDNDLARLTDHLAKDARSRATTMPRR